MSNEKIKNVTIRALGDHNYNLFPSFFNEITKNQNLRFLVKYELFMPKDFILKSESQEWSDIVKIDACEEYSSSDFLNFLYAKKYIDFLCELCKTNKEHIDDIKKEIVKISKEYGVLTKETSLVLVYGTRMSEVSNLVEFSVPIKDEILSRTLSHIFVEKDISFLLSEDLKQGEVEEIIDVIVNVQNNEGYFIDENDFNQDSIIMATIFSIISLMTIDFKKYKKNISKAVDCLTKNYYSGSVNKELNFALNMYLKKDISNKVRSRIGKLISNEPKIELKDVIENFEKLNEFYEKIKNREEVIISLNKVLILFFIRENLIS